MKKAQLILEGIFELDKFSGKISWKEDTKLKSIPKISSVFNEPYLALIQYHVDTAKQDGYSVNIKIIHKVSNE